MIHYFSATFYGQYPSGICHESMEYIMRTIIAITVTILFLLSCEKYDVDEKTMVIKYGTVCEMGYDSLTISGNDLWYTGVSNFDGNRIDRHENLSENEKESLISTLDKKEFAKINLNSCFVCVDGCDNWITVQDKNFFHKIRYAEYDSLEVAPIEDFINQLYLLKLKF
jgi:aldehyde:ferredoxin oxidoreductase